jgi:hypothetical protein
MLSLPCNKKSYTNFEIIIVTLAILLNFEITAESCTIIKPSARSPTSISEHGNVFFHQMNKNNPVRNQTVHRYTMGTTPFQRHGNNQPTPASTEVKEKVRLYLCPPLGLHGIL